jgi:hypothetical protein
MSLRPHGETTIDGDNLSAAVGAIPFIGGLKLLGHSAWQIVVRKKES